MNEYYTKTPYHIPRNQGWEPVFEKLVRRASGIQQANIKSGCHFENDTFKIQPTYLGNCICPYGKERKNLKSPILTIRTAFTLIGKKFKTLFEIIPNTTKH